MQIAVNLQFLQKAGYPMTDFVIEHKPKGEIICDFCSGRPVTACYHAQDFEMRVLGDDDPAIRAGSLGDWAACAQCETLIDTKDWEGLVSRSMKSFFHNYPGIVDKMSIAKLTEQMWSLYRQLRENNFFKKAAGSQ